MATYIQMVNKLLRKVNEVEVGESQFADAIGVTAVAKDSIIDALDKIYNKKHKWPFMARRDIITTSLNATEYAFPEDMLSVDWNSFVVLPQAERYEGSWVKPINYSEYAQYHQPLDLTWQTNSPTTGKGPPRFVVSNEIVSPPMFGLNSRGQNFFISPPPDDILLPDNITRENYRIVFKYFRKPTRPELPLDLIDIPEEWEYVVFSRALYHMYLFYDNNERATIADEDFKEGYKDMINTLLTTTNQHVTTGQVNQTGPSGTYTGYF